LTEKDDNGRLAYFEDELASLKWQIDFGEYTYKELPLPMALPEIGKIKYTDANGLHIENLVYIGLFTSPHKIQYIQI
jgi:hypothetical protein